MIWSLELGSEHSSLLHYIRGANGRYKDPLEARRTLERTLEGHFLCCRESHVNRCTLKFCFYFWINHHACESCNSFHTTQIFPCYIACLKLTAVKSDRWCTGAHSAYHIRKLFWSCYLVSEVLQLVFPFFLIWSQFLSTLVNCFDVPIHGWLYVHSYWGFFQHQPGAHPMCDPNTNHCSTHWNYTINSRTYTEVALGCFNLGWVAWVAILKGIPPVMPCYIWCCSSIRQPRM